MSRSPNNIRDQLSDALRRLAAVEGRQEDFQATVDILDSDVNRALEGIHDLLREQTQSGPFNLIGNFSCISLLPRKLLQCNPFVRF
jgi:hypothetical protein